jgi:hypothetical protein
MGTEARWRVGTVSCMRVPELAVCIERELRSGWPRRALGAEPALIATLLRALLVLHANWAALLAAHCDQTGSLSFVPSGPGKEVRIRLDTTY